MSPILLLHICAGTSGLLSGGVATCFRKGSPRHRLVGNAFVVSMLLLGATGAYMGFMKNQATNVVAGTLTVYLVATAWLAGRRSDGRTSILDRAALLFILAVGLSSLFYGLAGPKNGIPAGPFLFSGFVALLFAAADIRMLVRGGLSGKKRLVRHLWRMCFAWFFASGSLFLARPHLFPAVLRQAGVIVLLGILPLILMIFWLFRVRFANAYKKRPMPPDGNALAVRT